MMGNLPEPPLFGKKNMHGFRVSFSQENLYIDTWITAAIAALGRPVQARRQKPHSLLGRCPAPQFFFGRNLGMRSARHGHVGSRFSWPK